jgi:hypothetical protein
MEIPGALAEDLGEPFAEEEQKDADDEEPATKLPGGVKESASGRPRERPPKTLMCGSGVVAVTVPAR